MDLLVCVAVRPLAHTSAGGTLEAHTAGSSEWSEPNCRSLGSVAALRLPALPGPGLFAATAFLRDAFSRTAVATGPPGPTAPAACAAGAVSGAADAVPGAGAARPSRPPALSVVPAPAGALAQAPERHFRVASSAEEEAVRCTVTVDGAAEELVWRPARSSLYATARAFCVDRLGLHQVPPSHTPLSSWGLLCATGTCTLEQLTWKLAFARGTVPCRVGADAPGGALPLLASLCLPFAGGSRGGLRLGTRACSPGKAKAGARPIPVVCSYPVFFFFWGGRWSCREVGSVLPLACADLPSGPG